MALQFDGTNYGTWGRITALDGATQRTVSIWYYHNGALVNSVVIGNNAGTTGETQFVIWPTAAGSKHRVIVGSGPGWLDGDDNSWVSSVWQHYLFTWDGTADEVRLYIDGIAQAANPGGNQTPVLGDAQRDLILGGRASTPTSFNPPAGSRVFQSAIWDRILDPSEIAALAGGQSAETITAGLTWFVGFEDENDTADAVSGTTMAEIGGGPGMTNGPGPIVGVGPALTAPTETDVTETTATLGYNTDTAGGNTWVVSTQSATAPSATQIKAGQDDVGGAAVYASSHVPASGANSFAATGFTQGQQYYNYFVQNDGADDSNILESGVWETVSTAAPILSDPTQVDITETTATLGYTTDTAGDETWIVTTQSATVPSVAQIEAGQDHLGAPADFADSHVPVLGVNTFAAAGLDEGTDYYNYMHQHAGATSSAILESGLWRTVDAPPVLSSPSESDITETTATLEYATNTAGGNTWIVTTLSATTPSIAQIKAGQDATGSPAEFAASHVPALDINGFAATGFTAGTDYYNYFVQTDAFGDSNVLESGLWITLVPGAIHNMYKGPTQVADVFQGANQVDRMYQGPNIFWQK